MQHSTDEQIDDLRSLLSQESTLIEQGEGLAFLQPQVHFEALIFDAKAFSRSSFEERTYIKQYKQLLFTLYGNVCAFCRSSASLELDHAFLPKSNGGTFLLMQRNGRVFNNTIPLCDTCNKKKSNRPYEQVVPEHRREYINNINNRINDLLNQKLLRGELNEFQGKVNKAVK